MIVDVKKENLFKCLKMKWIIQWKVWKLKEKETKEKFKNKVKELAVEFWRLVKNFVKRENEGGSEEAHGGGIRKCKKQ